ncbi:MAG: hypothetical protein II811_09700 [Spirochaetaceae bacterium]|nr:hypothetical protein [Spirochaetaceae bacterium]
MTLKEKYERCLQDSENFITNEKVNVTPSYHQGELLARFFNKDLDYTDMNIHQGYPIEKFTKEDWDLKIKFFKKFILIKLLSKVESGILKLLVIID